jgi:hypothetical protein
MGAPSGQVMLQGLVALQVTRQVPMQSTAQLLTWSQNTWLPGPTRTPHRSTSWQLKVQFVPQKAPHVTVLWQSMWQLAPQSDEQSFTSWHSSPQSLPHTPPQWTMLWQYRSQRSPSAQPW